MTARLLKPRIPFLFLLTFGVLTASNAAEESELDNEIARLKRELARIRTEQGRTREAIERDREEFREYEVRTEERFTQLSSETDSIRNEIGEVRSRRDSLGAVLESVRSRQKEYEYRRRRLRTSLIEHGDTILPLIDLMPPAVREKFSPSVEFLKSELTTKTIDNIEGIHRLFQVFRDLDQQLMDIQIIHGASPVPEIPGTVYRLRIGGFFEAVVDAEGERCALFTGKDAEDSLWVSVENPELAQRVLKAVQVREGKTVPELVKLPLIREQEAAQ